MSENLIIQKVFNNYEAFSTENSRVIKGVDQCENFNKSRWHIVRFYKIRNTNSTVLLLQIKRKFMRTKFYRVLKLQTPLPELSKVGWTNWDEFSDII